MNIKSRFAVLLLILSACAARSAEPTLSVDLGNGVKLELVLVGNGSFMQGSSPTEAGRSDDETQRNVTITKDFYLGKFPVTRGQFARFVAETNYRTEAEVGTSGGFGFDGTKLVQRKDFTWRNPGFQQSDDHPVVLVTYADAQAFAVWFTKKAHRNAALPTEAQWEFACRAGTQARFYNGDADDDARAIAWMKTTADGGTRPVGTKQRNMLGLFDMSGNVYEWCRDWYGPYPPGAAVDPEQMRSDLSDKPRRVLRGGSWLKDPKYCRSAARYRNDARSRNADNGFRVMTSAEGAAIQAAPAFVPPVTPPPAPTVVAPVAPPSAIEVEVPEQRKVTTPEPIPSPARSQWSNQAQSSSAPVFFFVLVFFGIGALIVTWLIVKFLSRPPAAMNSAQGFHNIRPRPVADGFWLDGANLPRGSTVRYRYNTPDGIQEGTWRLDPGAQGQFVYTGVTPSEIVLLDVIQGVAGANYSSQPPYVPHSPPPVTRQASSFSGYPSAY